MAKKGQVQLQTEVTNEDEWEKLLQKDGLILVDIYSEWCGPCLGMSANLKKIKLEIGGDMLQLATAKCDYIEALKRFRNKSEPTWMFISKRKMVNLMFGADAPKLTRLIIAELKLETMATSGEQERPIQIEITDLADEEQVRFEAAEQVARVAREKEEQKQATELLDRKIEECSLILKNLLYAGTILIFPQARDHYQEAIHDLMNEAGLTIQHTEKTIISPEAIKDLCYFAEEMPFDEPTIKEMLENKSIVLVVGSKNEIDDVDDMVQHLVYGAMKKPPGSPESPAQVLRNTIEDEEGKQVEECGIWVPLNPLVRATMLKLFFPKLTSEYILPEPEPTPEHFAVVFDLSKSNNALQIAHKYPTEVLRYAYFTSEVPEEAELVAKSLRKLEQVENRTFKEKLVLEVTKRRSECVFEFAQLGPIYMSPNVEEGKRECEIFFPDDYSDSENEGEGVEFEAIVEEEQVEEQQEEEVSDEEEEEEGSEDEEEEEEEETADAVKISEEILEHLLYFTDYKKFPKKTIEDVVSNKLSLALLVKRTSETLPGDIDEVVLQLVYGNLRKPPGSENSPSQKLMVKIDNTEDEKGEKDNKQKEKEDDEEHTEKDEKGDEDNIMIGIWAPPNNLGKATVLKYLFPNISAPFVGPEIQPIPFYVAACYDAFKVRDVMELSEKYPGQVMSYGFFTSDIPAAAQLLAKTVDKFEERKPQFTYDEKIVIQLAKTIPECFMAFCELGPTYMSPDAIIGEMDCKLFFPPGYNVSEEEVKREKKKPRRKGKKRAEAVNKDASVTTSETTVDHSNEADGDHIEDETEEQDSEEEKPSEEMENESGATGADKATSPIHDKSEE